MQKKDNYQSMETSKNNRKHSKQKTPMLILEEQNQGIQDYLETLTLTEAIDY